MLYIEAIHRAPPLSWMEAYKGGSQKVSRVDNLEIACQIIVAGGGLAVLPAFIGDPVPEVVRALPDRVAVNTGWIVYHESARNTSRVRVVVDALIACFRTHESMFLGGPAQGTAGPAQ